MFRYNALRVMHDATSTCIRTNTRAFLSCSRPMSNAFLNVTNVPILRDLLLFRWTFFINSSNHGNGKANCAKTRKEIEERPNNVSCISFISLSLSPSLFFLFVSCFVAREGVGNRIQKLRWNLFRKKRRGTQKLHKWKLKAEESQRKHCILFL